MPMQSHAVPPAACTTPIAPTLIDASSVPAEGSPMTESSTT
jgi:hypothetical protein